MTPERKKKGISLANDFQAGLLLLRNVIPRVGIGVSVSRHTTLRGTEYDLYEPEGAPHRTVILLYGLVLAGERDPRLIRFARACATSGLRVVAPSLQGLKSFNFDEDDLTALSDLIIALKVQYGGSIGVIGFSAGGGIALTVAADPAVAEMVDPLLLFSPYYFLPDPWALLKTQTLSSPQNKRDWDHFIWSQLALAYRNLDALNLQTTERDELIDLLYSYCSERSLFRKKEFYERVLLWLDIPNIRTTPISSSTLEQFSPCGKLHRIRGRVLILHDPADLLIPPEHSEKIIAELNLRGKPDAQKLLITPLLSHVTPRSTWRVFDLLRILHLIGELFRR